MKSVVITGIGMVTPLGQDPEGILRRIRNNDTAATEPNFEINKFDCPLYAPITGFDAERFFPDNKTLRLMNRDAQMAVVAANLAMKDAEVIADQTYLAEDIALYGSTGVASMSIEEIERIIGYAANDDGSLNLDRFGKVALKRVRPVLSFRILANMPICFVSIFQNIKGPNAVYTPWEGHGAQAVATGIQAIRSGNVKCALVGGCDVKTRELSFINLQQSGALKSWKQYGRGPVPGEGSVFMVLEEERLACKRGVKAYARIRDHVLGSTWRESKPENLFSAMLSKLKINDSYSSIVVSSDDDIAISEREKQALQSIGTKVHQWIKPKPNLGNLFSAAAATQIGLAAKLTSLQKSKQHVLANCFGHGSEHASFLLEAL